jgi:ATP-dependent RNA helicase A
MGLSFNDNDSSRGGNNLLPYKRGAPESYLAHIRQMANRKMVEEAEDTDNNAEIHGFWNIENAKSRLHQYLQMSRINTDYRYKSTGPDNNRYF